MRGGSPQMLEEMGRANLFVVPLDEQRQWYRYHDLFREALLARLQASQPKLVPLLHLRAARFYERASLWRGGTSNTPAPPSYPERPSLLGHGCPPVLPGGDAQDL